MNNENDFSRLELSLPSCRANLRYFKSRIKATTKLLVLVKANAYGHGAVDFASMLQNQGVDYLAVALPIEGIELRKNGISLPILVLTCGTDFFNEMIDYRLEPGIPNLDTLKVLCESLKKRKISNYPIHIKLDTGMHRLGFMTSELNAMLEFLKNQSEVRVKSIYSHLAASDNPHFDAFTLEQVALFTQNATTIGQSLGYKPLWHILNSAGIERFPQFQFDMVRLGIGIYGISALEGVKLHCVASLKVKILQIKHLSKEDGTVGYDRCGLIPPSGITIATLPVGYADGIDRRLGCGRAYFSVNGTRVPTIGNICMDMCMIDVSEVDTKVGDTVTIFGQDPSVEEIAQILGTIPYEIWSSIPRRIERIITKQ